MLSTHNTYMSYTKTVSWCCMVSMCTQHGWLTLEVLLSEWVPRSLWEAVQFLAFCMSRTVSELLLQNICLRTDCLLLTGLRALTRRPSTQYASCNSLPGHAAMHNSAQQGRERGAGAYMALIQHKGAVEGLSTAPVHDLREPGPRPCKGRASASLPIRTAHLGLAVQSSLTGMQRCTGTLWVLRTRLLIGRREHAQQCH